MGGIHIVTRFGGKGSSPPDKPGIPGSITSPKLLTYRVVGTVNKNLKQMVYDL
jgi:hypothetical protein